MLQVPTKKLTRHSTLPKYGSAGAIGADLFADFTDDVGSVYVLAPGERRLFKTGIAMAIPEGYYGRVAPRSGLAVKQGIMVLAGVIDSDYRGEIGVILFNSGFIHNKPSGTIVPADDVIIKHGDRIAQIIFERADVAHLKVVDELEDTARDAGGFGSTGV